MKFQLDSWYLEHLVCIVGCENTSCYLGVGGGGGGENKNYLTQVLSEKRFLVLLIS